MDDTQLEDDDERQVEQEEEKVDLAATEVPVKAGRARWSVRSYTRSSAHF